LRLALVAIVLAVAWSSSRWWSPAVARSLVCAEDLTPSDALLIENFDPDYLLFERARILRRAGVAARVVVPVHVDGRSGEPNDVAKGIADLMARIARLGDFEVVPIPQVEPISLNAGRAIRRHLEVTGVRSVTVVAPVYRSRRSALVYRATLGRASIAVRCAPVQGTRTPDTWTRTWHGIQDVGEQWMKLQYYRFYVLPFLAAGEA
jgi:hypothetical protein